MRSREDIENELKRRQANLLTRPNSYEHHLQMLNLELLLDIREQLAQNNVKLVVDTYKSPVEKPATNSVDWGVFDAVYGNDVVENDPKEPKTSKKPNNKSTKQNKKGKK